MDAPCQACHQCSCFVAAKIQAPESCKSQRPGLSQCYRFVIAGIQALEFCKLESGLVIFYWELSISFGCQGRPAKLVINVIVLSLPDCKHLPRLLSHFLAFPCFPLLSLLLSFALPCFVRALACFCLAVSCFARALLSLALPCSLAFLALLSLALPVLCCPWFTLFPCFPSVPCFFLVFPVLLSLAFPCFALLCLSLVFPFTCLPCFCLLYLALP